MTDNIETVVLFNIDGYDVEVHIMPMSFFEEAIPEDDGMSRVGTMDYQFTIHYDFEDQEAYDAVHRMVDNKIPEYVNDLIHKAISAMIESEPDTATNT